MHGILDLIKDQPMPQQEAPTQPKPDEVAQIVIAQVDKVGVIVRFKDEKKAKKAFEQLHAKWTLAKWPDNKEAEFVVLVKGDMFDTIVDLSTVLHMSLVIHKVAGKFVPWRG